MEFFKPQRLGVAVTALVKSDQLPKNLGKCVDVVSLITVSDLLDVLINQNHNKHVRL